VLDNETVALTDLAYPLYPNNFALNSGKVISVNEFSPKK